MTHHTVANDWWDAYQLRQKTERLYIDIANVDTSLYTTEEVIRQRKALNDIDHALYHVCILLGSVAQRAKAAGFTDPAPKEITE